MGRPKTRGTQAAIRFDADLWDALQEVAVQFGRPRTDIVNAALYALVKLPAEKRKAIVLEYLVRKRPEATASSK